MTCYRPLQAIRSSDGLVHVVPKTYNFSSFDKSVSLQLPCGKCIGCRLDYSKQWTVRNCHEAELYEYNTFVTFTYNDYFNDFNAGSLCYRDFTLFMKRLRKAISTRFEECGFFDGK